MNDSETSEEFIDGIVIWLYEKSDKNNGNISNDEPDEEENFRRRIEEGLCDFDKVIKKWKTY